MASTGSRIVQQQGRIVVIRHHHIHVAVIIEISKSASTPRVRCCKSFSRILGHFEKCAVPLVVKQGINLLIPNIRTCSFDFLINVPVCDKKIQPPVIVVIEKSTAEAQHVLSRLADTGRFAHLLKKALPVVVPYMIGR